MTRLFFIEGVFAAGLCSLPLFTAACSGTGDTAGTGGAGSTSSSTAASSTASSTSTSSTSTSSTSTSSSSSSGGGDPAAYAVLVRGTFKAADIAMAKMQHDTLATMGEAGAKMLGDTSHHALLGTTLLGTTQNAFVGVDTWTNTAGIDKFYSDPNFMMAFGALFSSPPVVEQFVHQPKWYGWGDLKSGAAFNPYFYIVVRGKLKDADPVKAQAAHDAVAMGAETKTKMAGDVAHVVFTGRTDPQDCFVVDIWKDSTNIVAVYSDPQLQMAFATVFAGMPTLGVYSSTDWHQW